MKDIRSYWEDFAQVCIPKSIKPEARKSMCLAYCAGMLALRAAYAEEALQPREAMMAAVRMMNSDLDAFAAELLTDLEGMASAHHAELLAEATHLRESPGPSHKPILPTE